MDDVTNRDRAKWAMAALEAFTDQAGGKSNGLYLNIQDLLCNLRHVCRQRKLNWQDVLESSEVHFAEEIGLYWVGPEDDLSRLPHCHECANRTPYTFKEVPYCVRCYEEKKPWKSKRSPSKTSART